MKSSKKIHFISLGSRAINDLAIELKKSGHEITGSLDEMPADEKDKLLRHNIIGESTKPGHPTGIVDAIIFGPTTKENHPDLAWANANKVPAYSIPDFIYESSRDKHRLVVTGNHGKAFITALIVHILSFNKRKFDYFTSTHPQGFEGTVKLSDAPIIIIEGQDISTSLFDSTPAFLKYHQHIGVINGIEWQASSLYPTRDSYVRQFGQFGASMPKGGVLVYFEMDPVVAALPIRDTPDVLFVAYKTHPSVVENGREYLLTPEKEKVSIKVSGKHNMQNISAAQETLKRIGVTNEMFYRAVSTFENPMH